MTKFFGWPDRTGRDPLPRGLLRLSLTTLLLLAPSGAFCSGASARFELDAAGRHSAVVRIGSIGRYAFVAGSESGVALELVDRMRGPWRSDGVAGKTDGRVDVLLDEGEVKAVLRGNDKATDKVTLTVTPFTELNRNITQLIRLEWVHEEMGDLEQRSYWIKLDKKERVDVEAAGRTVSDLRIFKDGNWLTEAEPRAESYEPREGKPLKGFTISHVLGPGLYRITAYGGKPLTWAEDDGTHPFHIRMGVPDAEAERRVSLEMNPLGVERHLVEGRANYFRLELPETADASFSVSDLGEDPYRTGGSRGSISKKSRLPTAEINRGGAASRKILTIRAAAGQPYVIQHFERRENYTFHAKGTYWVSTLHGGYAGDAVDVTAIVRDRDGIVPHLSTAIPLGRGTSWSRRVNVLDTFTVFVEVATPGNYVVDLGGLKAEYRFEPFFFNREHLGNHRNYRTPDFSPAGKSWALDKDFYTLEINPIERGVATIRVFNVGSAAPGEPSPPPASFNFGVLTSSDSHHYGVELNRRPDAPSGLVVRKSPVRLAVPLPLSLRPGETVELAVQNDEPSILKITEEGNTKSIAANLFSGPVPEGKIIEAGTYPLALTNRGDRPVWFSAAFVSLKSLEKPTLPTFSPEEFIAMLPRFDTLEVDRPAYFDLGRSDSRTFLVKVPEDGLYRLESTGLLDTEGTFRSRLITDLGTAESGGSGRNFVLQQYLLSGDYQVTVRTRGRSAGRAGLVVGSRKPLEVGTLVEGVAARHRLSTGHAVSYGFLAEKKGVHEIEALGLGRDFRVRVEDLDGWPLWKPGGDAPIRWDFDPGAYRLIVLPQPLETRSLALYSRIPDEPIFEGHGPHRLGIGGSARFVWREPPEGGERTPDVWTFTLPGNGEVTIGLTNEMAGDLYRAESGERVKIARVPSPVVGRTTWTGILEMGDYRLEAVNSRRNDSVEYEVRIDSRPLMVGMRREVSAHSTVPLSVGADEMVEISSLSYCDVSARLLRDGREVAYSDDTTDDWNFYLSNRLEAGAYELRLSSEQKDCDRVRLSMKKRDERIHDAISTPADFTLVPGQDLHLYPLAGVPRQGVLELNLSSREVLGMALEVNDEGRWTDLAVATGRSPSIAVPLPIGEARLRLWSLEQRAEDCRVEAVVADLSTFSEAELREGAGEGAAMVEVKLDRPGALRLLSSGGPLRWSNAPGSAMRELRGDVVTGSGSIFIDSGGASVKAVRIVLGRETTILREPGWIDIPAEPATTRVVAVRARGADPGFRGPMGVARGAAATVDIGEGASRAVYVTSSRAEAGGELLLHAFTFSDAVPSRTAESQETGTLAPGERKSFLFPATDKQLRISGAAGLIAAVYGEGPDLDGVVGAGTDPFSATLTTAARRVDLFCIGEEPAAFKIETSDAHLGDAIGRGGGTYERWFAAAGSAIVGIGEEVRTISSPDESVELTFVGSDGFVRRGNPVAAGMRGFVVADHGQGLLALVGDAGKGMDATAWGGASFQGATRLEVPSSVALSGPQSLFAISPETKSIITAKVEAQAVIRVETPEAGFTRYLEKGGVVRFGAPAATTHIGVRAVAGQGLSGVLALTAIPVAATGEGLGPQVLLPPGSAHGFTFEVNKPGSVGFGVHADSGEVEAELLDDRLRMISSGVVGMIDLEPGTYYLVAYCKSGGKTAAVRPAVVGLEKPGVEPPIDVVRKYIEEDAR